MATAPNEQFDDELLSAYLDGELDAATRAAVDERLRTDERARKLFAELRQASEAVRALPRVTLGRDLRGSVLAAIERAAVEPASIQMRRGEEVIRSTGRGWMWAGLTFAIAASVMVVAAIPTRLRNEDAATQVAVASKDTKEREAKSGGEASAPAATELADGEAAMQAAPAAPAPAASTEQFAGGAGGKLNPQQAARTAAAPMSTPVEQSVGTLKGAIPPPPSAAAEPADEASGDALAEDKLDVQVIEAGDVTRFNEILTANQIDVSDAELPVDVEAKLAAAVEKDDSAFEAVLVEATPQQLAAIRQALASRADGAARYAAVPEGAQQSQEGQDDAESIRGRAWRMPQPQVAADRAAAPLASATSAGESAEAASGEPSREGLVRALFLLKRPQ